MRQIFSGYNNVLMMISVYFLINIAQAEQGLNQARDLPDHDIIVAADGSGNFKTIQEAINSIPKDNVQRIIILIKDGVYDEKVVIDRNYITLLGQSRDKTRIELSFPFPYKNVPLDRAVMNIYGTDVIVQRLTISNTQPKSGTHAFTIFSRAPCTRTILFDCNILSNGYDTLSLWADGMYYHADCYIKGHTDFVCPQGWNYITRTKFVQSPQGGTLWHNGDRDESMKLVVKDSSFEGSHDGSKLGYYYHAAQFYLINCEFPENMKTGFHVQPLAPRDERLRELSYFGLRAYYYNCHRKGGDLPWHADNLDKAKGSPKAEQITAAWTFNGKWDPERTAGPKVISLKIDADTTRVTFNETVTVKGSPSIILKSGRHAKYISGSGSDTLIFEPISSNDSAVSLDQSQGAIIASLATITVLRAENSL